MDEKILQNVLNIRRKFLHAIGDRMRGIISNGSVTFHFNRGEYTGVHDVVDKANKAKEK